MWGEPIGGWSMNQVRNPPTRPLRILVEYCFAGTAVFAIALFAMDAFGWLQWSTESFSIFLTNGGIVIWRDPEIVRGSFYAWEGWHFLAWPVGEPRGPTFWRPEFGVERWVIQLWPVIVVSIGCWLQLLILRWKHVNRVRSARTCDRCGYSLVGNESGVCPECGAVAERLGSVPMESS